jgi:hypothetical protein
VGALLLLAALASISAAAAPSKRQFDMLTGVLFAVLNDTVPIDRSYAVVAFLVMMTMIRQRLTGVVMTQQLFAGSSKCTEPTTWTTMLTATGVSHAGRV